MFIDAQNQFSDAQALTATAVGTNVIDLSLARSIGNGEPMAVLFSVDVAADQTTGDEDYTFDVEIATAADQSAGAQLMGRRVFESGTPGAPAQDADLLVAGYSFSIPLPATTLDEAARYLGVRYTLAGTTPSVTVTAQLVPQSFVDGYNTYSSGYSIT
jgi:hypothetical protein